MNCIICYKQINKDIYICGNNHKYHTKCLHMFKNQNKDKCFICSQYLSLYIENVLNTLECDIIINIGKNMGFTDTQYNKYKKQYTDSNIRTNKMCVLENNSLSNKIYNKIKDILPLGTTHINNYLRCMEYKQGDYIVKHKDAKFNNYLLSNMNNKKFNSKYSLITYLSDCEGGETRIYNDTNTYYDIKPKQGSIFIFHQDLYHEGLPVINGIKYIIVTELLEQSYNIEDDNNEDWHRFSQVTNNTYYSDLRLTYNEPAS